jgi:hypothetical protein
MQKMIIAGGTVYKINRPIKFLGIMLTISVCIFSGCSKDDKANSTAASTTSELEGTWYSGCLAYGNGGTKVANVFAGNTNAKTAFYFINDASCGNGDFRIDTSHTISLGSTADATTGAKSIDWTVTTYDATPLTANGATTMNSQSYCGLTNWVVGVTQNTLALNCGGITVNTGTVDYDIFKITEGTLVFGYDNSGVNDGSTAEKRPSTLGTITYTK